MTPAETYIAQVIINSKKRLQGKADVVYLDDPSLHSLADCTEVPAKAAWPCNKKDENPMTNAYSSATIVTADSIEKDQRRALATTAYDAMVVKKTALKRQFGLLNDDAPDTITDLLKRIADGKFSVPEKYQDSGIYNFFNFVEWRDPAVVQDRDGYKAARAELISEFEKLKLRLAIIPVADALVAVESFRDAK